MKNSLTSIKSGLTRRLALTLAKNQLGIKWYNEILSLNLHFVSKERFVVQIPNCF